jgi:hypothetical protein
MLAKSFLGDVLPAWRAFPARVSGRARDSTVILVKNVAIDGFCAMCISGFVETIILLRRSTRIAAYSLACLLKF